MLTTDMIPSIFHTRRPLILPLAAISLFTACNHKELDDLPQPDFRVRVKFNWHHAPDADPSLMQVFFYNRSTGNMQYDVLPSVEGGYVDLEEGDWQVTTYNLEDVTNIIGENSGSFANHHLTTRAGNILEGALGNSQPPTLGEDQRVLVTPDMVWGEAREGISIHPEPGQREVVVTLEPEELVCHYSFEILHVENLSNITNMCAALTGMSGGMTFSTSLLDLESVTLPLTASPDGPSTIKGEFYTFGFNPENRDPKMMNLYVWLDDGRKLVYGTTEDAQEKWNVSDQIRNAVNPKRVHYIIDGLSIPATMDGGMFNPSTDDWTTKDYEIGI